MPVVPMGPIGHKPMAMPRGAMRGNVMPMGRPIFQARSQQGRFGTGGGFGPQQDGLGRQQQGGFGPQQGGFGKHKEDLYLNKVVLDHNKDDLVNNKEDLDPNKEILDLNKKLANNKEALHFNKVDNQQLNHKFQAQKEINRKK